MPDQKPLHKLKYNFITKSEKETRSLGEAIGGFLVGGEVLCLYGDLGVGKTCLAQGIICSLGVTEDKYPPSPTYSIINMYSGKKTLFHVDLYRLNSVDEVYEVGFEELIEGDNTIIVEWAEKLENIYLENRIDIFIHTKSKHEREITIDVDGSKFNLNLESHLQKSESITIGCNFSERF